MKELVARTFQNVQAPGAPNAYKALRDDLALGNPQTEIGVPTDGGWGAAVVRGWPCGCVLVRRVNHQGRMSDEVFVCEGHKSEFEARMA